jgi:lipopolysaccharide exporter
MNIARRLAAILADVARYPQPIGLNEEGTTATVRDSILTKTARGAGWMIGWRALTRVLGLASTLTLVRLLVPDDFGLVALATGFSQGILALSALGIDEAVIRQRSATREVYDTAFTINLIRGLATALMVAACAWPVSAFFNEPRLTPILLVLAACGLVTSFENIGTIEFRRDFLFGKEFRLLLFPRLSAVAVTIVAAVVWRSYWALIAGIATGQILEIVMGYYLHPYRPHLGLAAWRQLAAFSFWSWAISVAIMIRDRVDGFVIGRLLGVAQVGVYSVGAEIGLTPTYELAAPLGRACFPGFAAAMHHETEVASTYSRILASVILVVLPIGTGLSLVAAPVVMLAFGPAWFAATGVVRILGLSGVVLAPGLVTAMLLSAHALLRPAFLVNMMSMAVRAISALLLVSLFGLIGAAGAHALTIVVENVAYMIVAFRRFQIRTTDVLLLIWRGLLATLAMAAALTLGGLGNDTAAPAQSLGIAVAVGGVVYGGVLLGTWLLCSRPQGAEKDLLALARRVVTVLGMRRFSRLRRAG